MTATAIDSLHDIHTATNDVLKGYREMLERAKADVQPTIRSLTDMHERHAAEQEAELSRLRDANTDDSSLQGTVNKVVVILRDWISNVDRDVLPAVRDGEESLRDQYNKALEHEEGAAAPGVGLLLRAQREQISDAISRLPKG